MKKYLLPVDAERVALSPVVFAADMPRISTPSTTQSTASAASTSGASRPPKAIRPTRAKGTPGAKKTSVKKAPRAQGDRQEAVIAARLLVGRTARFNRFFTAGVFFGRFL